MAGTHTHTHTIYSQLAKMAGSNSVDMRDIWMLNCDMFMQVDLLITENGQLRFRITRSETGSGTGQQTIPNGTGF